jgi:hypothetical protein
MGQEEKVNGSASVTMQIFLSKNNLKSNYSSFGGCETLITGVS